MQNTPVLTYPPYQPAPRQQSFAQTIGVVPPAGIIPMHNHPRPTLPQETQRRWNALANLGVGLAILSAVLVAASPFPAFQRLIQKNVSEKTWQSITKNGKKTLTARGWQLVGIAGILQGINRFETASNTNQPSKIMGALLNAVQMIGFLRWYKGAIQLLTFVKGAFLYAGEKNDVENSNHPDLRREWEVSRLTKPLLAGNFSQLAKETVSASKFMYQDMKNAFAFKHWKSLGNTIHYKKNDWLTPQSYQSALGVQSSLISGLAYLTSMFLPGKSVLFDAFKNLTNMFGSSIPQIPLVMRAWENRDQVDGKLVLLGSPLIVLGRIFQMNSNAQLQVLGGFGPVGDSVKGKGLALNSQKYLALLNQMRSLQLITERDPYVTAQTILEMMATSPDVMDRMRRQMGQSRLDFLISLLKQARQENLRTGISLNDFLTPILEIKDHESASSNAFKA